MLALGPGPCRPQWPWSLRDSTIFNSDRKKGKRVAETLCFTKINMEPNHDRCSFEPQKTETRDFAKVRLCQFLQEAGAVSTTLSSMWAFGLRSTFLPPAEVRLRQPRSLMPAASERIWTLTLKEMPKGEPIPPETSWKRMKVWCRVVDKYNIHQYTQIDKKELPRTLLSVSLKTALQPVLRTWRLYRPDGSADIAMSWRNRMRKLLSRDMFRYVSYCNCFASTFNKPWPSNAKVEQTPDRILTLQLAPGSFTVKIQTTDTKVPPVKQKTWFWHIPKVSIYVQSMALKSILYAILLSFFILFLSVG